MLAHALLAQGVHLVAHQVVHMAAVRQLLILKVLRAGVGGTAQHKQALALLLHIGQIGSNGIHAHVGGQGHKVGLEVPLKVALGVHFGSFCNVAPLDVRNDGHARGAHSLQGFSVGTHTVQAQALIVGHLHLVAAADGLGRLDDGLIEAQDVLTGGQLRAHKLLRQIGKIGVQAHAHRAAGFHRFVQLVHIGHRAILLL